jgi:hypothetical protein
MNKILWHSSGSEGALFFPVDFQEDMTTLRTRCIVEVSLQWLRSDISPVVVIDFMKFLRRPDVDADIELIVDKNQGYGTLPPYKQAKQEIALKYFSADHALISQLIELDEKMYELQKNKDFQKMLEERMALHTKMLLGTEFVWMGNISNIALHTQYWAQLILQEKDSYLTLMWIDAVQEEQNTYLEQMENMHFSELDENDKSAYLMMSAECIDQIRPRTDLIAFWKGRTWS